MYNGDTENIGIGKSPCIAFPTYDLELILTRLFISIGVLRTGFESEVDRPYSHSTGNHDCFSSIYYNMLAF